MNDDAQLTDCERAIFDEIRVPLDMVHAQGIRHVSHEQAKDVCGIRYKSDHLEGLGIPNWSPITDTITGWSVRRANPELKANGDPIAKYIDSLDRHRLYFLRGSGSRLSDTSVPVIIPEAQKSVLAITAAALRAQRPVLVIGTGGCWSWHGTRGKTTNANGVRVDEKGPLLDLDWVTWTNRHVFVVFDGDAATNKSVRAARRRISAELQTRGAVVHHVHLPIEPGINGPDDYIGKHGDAAFWRLVDSAQTVSPSDQAAKVSQATILVHLVEESGATLWHTPGGDSYISISTGGHCEHYPLESRAAKDHLAMMYFDRHRTAPNASSLQDAIAVLSGKARYAGDEHDVFVRIAAHQGRIYLDLGDPSWRAIEVGPDGWRVVPQPPVRFRRPRGLQPLPVPEHGGSIAELRPFVNVEDDGAFVLLTMWGLATFRAKGPYPIVIFNSEHGSAKTTTSRVMRRLIDPNEADTRRPPKNTEDLQVAAHNGHVVAFDNLSRLSQDMSDDLSSLATGSGFAARRLYTNADESIFSGARPIALNGIRQVASAHDLLDRAIVLTLPPIPDEQRKDEEDFWREFNEARPRILGALLDAVAIGLRNRPHTRLARKPRMADFALWSVAAEPGCPWEEGTFLRVYLGNRQEAVEAMLEGNSVADLVKDHLVPRTGATWGGTASDLLAAANLKVPQAIRDRKEWYTKPKQIADELRTIAPSLRKTGIDVRFLKRKNSQRPIHIAREGGRASPASPASFEAENQASTGDEPGDAAGAAPVSASPSLSVPSDAPRDEPLSASPPASPGHPNKNRPGDGGDASDAGAPFPYSEAATSEPSIA